MRSCRRRGGISSYLCFNSQKSHGEKHKLLTLRICGKIEHHGSESSGQDPSHPTPDSIFPTSSGASLITFLARSIDEVPMFMIFAASSRVAVSEGLETTSPIGEFDFAAFAFPAGAPCFSFAHFAPRWTLRALVAIGGDCCSRIGGGWWWVEMPPSLGRCTGILVDLSRGRTTQVCVHLRWRSW